MSRWWEMSRTSDDHPEGTLAQSAASMITQECCGVGGQMRERADPPHGRVPERLLHDRQARRSCVALFRAKPSLAGGLVDAWLAARGNTARPASRATARGQAHSQRHWHSSSFFFCSSLGAVCVASSKGSRRRYSTIPLINRTRIAGRSSSAPGPTSFSPSSSFALSVINSVIHDSGASASSRVDQPFLSSPPADHHHLDTWFIP
ncbi:uncharacterized protein K452DRAFT_124888 [Aplosporella prunicola CBS 121167]|uniref:Uncharacterized protein n=1 Tax=Aplosporella prunicola CBS 121167 TaxID=1176127 RepID=A0A6A6BQQ0_9PEZI|nr:uncharacterized protein K452DRAFT_124888 [Aplosporella prunicola CBS 121167]KAF2145753.1 hypothetical protein K452DRAFT_124888 [Aplosporella prunicola CBS 121167]